MVAEVLTRIVTGQASSLSTFAAQHKREEMAKSPAKKSRPSKGDKVDRPGRARMVYRFLESRAEEDPVHDVVKEVDPGHEFLEHLGWADDVSDDETQWLDNWEQKGGLQSWLKVTFKKWRDEWIRQGKPAKEGPILDELPANTSETAIADPDPVPMEEAMQQTGMATSTPTPILTSQSSGVPPPIIGESIAASDPTINSSSETTRLATHPNSAFLGARSHPADASCTTAAPFKPFLISTENSDFIHSAPVESSRTTHQHRPVAPTQAEPFRTSTGPIAISEDSNSISYPAVGSALRIPPSQPKRTSVSFHAAQKQPVRLQHMHRQTQIPVSAGQNIQQPSDDTRTHHRYGASYLSHEADLMARLQSRKDPSDLQASIDHQLEGLNLDSVMRSDVRQVRDNHPRREINHEPSTSEFVGGDRQKFFDWYKTVYRTNRK